MMLAAKAATNFWQRRVRQRFAEVHRNLPRHRDRLRVVPRLQIHQLQVVVVGNMLLNRLDRHGLFFVIEDIPEYVLRERQ